ncbi:MAG: hypothetical protein WDO70_07065 [Alphaproteobacteria bacterium]
MQAKTILFQTTPEQRVQIPPIALELRRSGQAASFVESVMEVAGGDQGVFDMLSLWKQAKTEQDRGAALADLKDMVLNYGHEVPGMPAPKVPKTTFSPRGDIIQND